MHIQNISQSTSFPRCRQMAGCYTGGIQLRWGGWAVGLGSVAGSSLGERQPLLLSLCIASTSAMLATLYLSPLFKHWDVQGCQRLADIYRLYHSVTLIVSLQWTLLNMNMRYKDAHSLCSFPSSHAHLFLSTPVYSLPIFPGPYPISQDIYHCP